MDEIIVQIGIVLVAKNPGDFFESTLESIDKQAFPNTTVLVIDNGSDQPLLSRVAAVNPNIFVSRLDEDKGFSYAVNLGCSLIKDATHFLICHDDVVLADGFLNAIVTTAVRENAAIVQPKYVDPRNDSVITNVGWDVDFLYVRIPRHLPGELDQGQHDITSDIPAAAGGALLIRADVFKELGGFDASLPLCYEDVDISVRAHSIGARVLVEPNAICKHYELVSSLSRDSSFGPPYFLIRRAEIKLILAQSSFVRRWLLIFVAGTLSVLEIIACLILNRRQRLRMVVNSWIANLTNYSVIKARRKTRPLEIKGDLSVSALTVNRPVRLRRLSHYVYDRRYISEDTDTVLKFALACLAGLIVIFGFRSQIFGDIKPLGQFGPMASLNFMIKDVITGYSLVDYGLKGSSVFMTGIAGLSYIFPLSPSFIFKLVIVILIFASGRQWGRLGDAVAEVLGISNWKYYGLGLTVFAFSPVVGNIFSVGSLDELVLLCALPYLLRVVTLSAIKSHQGNKNTRTSTSTFIELVFLSLLFEMLDIQFVLVLIIMLLVSATYLIAMYRKPFNGSTLVRWCALLIGAVIGLSPLLINVRLFAGGIYLPTHMNVLSALSFGFGNVGGHLIVLIFGLIPLVAYLIAPNEVKELALLAIVLWAVSLVLSALLNISNQIPTVVLGPEIFCLISSFISVCIIFYLLTTALKSRSFGFRQVLGSFAALWIVLACWPGFFALLNGNYYQPTAITNTALYTSLKKSSGTGIILWVYETGALPFPSCKISGSPFSIAVTLNSKIQASENYFVCDNAILSVGRHLLEKMGDPKAYDLSEIVSELGISNIILVTANANQGGHMKNAFETLINGLDVKTDLIEQFNSQDGYLFNVSDISSGIVSSDPAPSRLDLRNFQTNRTLLVKVKQANLTIRYRAPFEFYPRSHVTNIATSNLSFSVLKVKVPGQVTFSVKSNYWSLILSLIPIAIALAISLYLCVRWLI